MDDDVAEATLTYIEENRKNFHTYLRPVQNVDVPIQPEPSQPEVKEDGEAQ